MAKKLHVNCYLVEDAQADAFRHLVRTYNEPASYEEYQAEGFEPREPTVEILYEESGRGRTGFDLWFETSATGFYFGLAWGQRLAELAQQPTAPATYPQFLYYAKLGYWVRYHSPTCFCLVSASQLQVRRERPQELFKPDEVESITEEQFLAAYHQTRQLLQDVANQYLSLYQRRGSEGNEWFYCNPLYAAATGLPQHLRLNSSVDEYGRSWQLLHAHDTRRYDPRRVASAQAEFEAQLHAMLADVEAVATGQEGGQQDG